MRLPIRAVGVEQEESAKAILLRVSAANRYPDFRQVLEIARLPIGFAERPCDLGALATLIGVAPSELEQAACWPVHTHAGLVSFGPVRISSVCVDLTHPKICIRCIGGGDDENATKIFARRIWDVRAFLACPRHGCLLVDTCPSCMRRLTWVRPALDRCKCGASLLDAEVTPAPADVMAVARRLEALCKMQQREMIPEAGMAPMVSIDAAARLVWVFGTSAPLSSGANGHEWRSRFLSKPNVAASLSIVENGAPVLLKWPDGLIARLTKHRRRSVERVGLVAEFGPLMRHLRTSLRDPEFAFVFDAIRNWLASEWDGGFVKPWSFFYRRPSTSARFVPGTVAAAELGTTQARVATMIGRGTLEGESHAMGRRRQLIVSTQDLAEARARSAATLSSADTAQWLGVSAFELKALRRHGLLGNIHRQLERSGVSRDALNAFMMQLWERSTPWPRGYPASQAVTLSSIPKLHRIGLVDVIDHILADAVAVHRRKRSSHFPRSMFERLCINRTQVLGRQMFGTAEEFLSVREAAERLRVATRMVPVLVHHGCLETSPTSARIGPLGKCRITPASIAAFRSRFTMSRELARAHHTSTRRIANCLCQAGMRPVVFSNTQRGISAVWRTADLEDADIQGLLSMSAKPGGE